MAMDNNTEIISAYDCTEIEAERRVRKICDRYAIPPDSFQAHRIAVESNISFASADALAARMQVAWQEYRKGLRKDWWTW
jgi:hypothetical protein